MSYLAMIRIGNILILNGDTQAEFNGADGEELCPLTCGLSRRSTVTASSIGEEGFTYCLQRGIYTLSGQTLPPQEFNVAWGSEPEDLYPYLAIVTLMLICGVQTDIFEYLKF